MTALALLLVVSQLYIAFGSLNTTSQGSCRHGWISFQESCYLFSHTMMSWPDAEEACEILHSNLATVQTEEQQQFLKSYLNTVHAKDYPLFAYWIDGNDLEFAHEWQWSSIGQPLNYTDWGPGEPSKLPNENCLLLWGPFHFKMGDYGCYNLRHFICQQRSPVAPPTNSINGWVAFGR
ncbi:perlucin-like [Ylistrum balloti]|uniref:perlucin-like n=1 Tax=Ylistrum balloti TaxID=509963 RepID=UPI002905C335|nr:perlucin-like [Ylistrum balloti]